MRPKSFCAFLILGLSLAACTPAAAQVDQTRAPAATASLAPTVGPTSTATQTAAVASPSVAPTPTGGPSGLRLVGYFYGVNHNNHASDIPADQLTAILYAFVDVSDGGECVSADPAADQANFPQLQRLKQQHPQLTTLISIGGYSHSGKFSDAALTAESRRQFAQSCVAFMRQNGFDGIDIDWEYPVRGGLSSNLHRPEDKQNFTALVGELRRQLDDAGAADHKHYALTIAAPAGPSEYANLELGALASSLDWINLETYAFYTAASPITNFNAPLYASSSDPTTNDTKRLDYNADAAVRAYLAAGVPADKIVLGVPFYGRGWKGVPNSNQGLYQPDTGPATDTRAPKGTWKDGAIDYGDIEKYYLGSYTRYWQEEAKEPWLYSSSSGIMITYEDPQSLGLKADYARVQHLGGIMIWQLSADDAQHSLVNALYPHLHP
jgi:chitinase